MHLFIQQILASCNILGIIVDLFIFNHKKLDLILKGKRPRNIKLINSSILSLSSLWDINKKMYQNTNGGYLWGVDDEKQLIFCYFMLLCSSSYLQ